MESIIHSNLKSLASKIKFKFCNDANIEIFYDQETNIVSAKVTTNKPYVNFIGSQIGMMIKKAGFTPVIVFNDQDCPIKFAVEPILIY